LLQRRNRGQPAADQIGPEGRAVDVTLPAAEHRAVPRVGHPAAVPVGGHHLVEGAGDADQHVGKGRDMGSVVGIGQHAGVLGG